MTRFVFSLAPVLHVRRTERDLLARKMDALHGEHGRLLDAKDGVLVRRFALLDELRHLPTASQGLDIQGTLARHAYAERLAEEVALVDTALRDIALCLEKVRADLLHANQQVEGLERLEARQRAAHGTRLEHQETLALEEGWQARHGPRLVAS